MRSGLRRFGLVTLLFDRHRRFAGTAAEIIKAGFADLGILLDLDLFDVRRAHWKHTLDALAVAAGFFPPVARAATCRFRRGCPKGALLARTCRGKRRDACIEESRATCW